MPRRQHDSRIAAVRRFNRFYTRQIGVLRKKFLDSPYSLGEARVLYEIASGHSLTATDIGRALDLDAGYLSRVLRNFEKRGLVRRTASATDARQSHLTLSPRGRKAYGPLEQGSQRDTGTMLDKLAPADQARLIAAMQTIESLLGGEEPAERPLAPPIDCARRCQAISAGWSSATAKFTPRNTAGPNRSKACARRSSPTSPTRTIPNASAAGSPRWTARLSAACSWPRISAKGSTKVARIRLLLVDPKARGLGVGARLVDECIRFARRAGYKKITLWTHSVLTAARHIYQKAGFRLMRTERHRSWGRPVVSEHWDLEL